MLGQLGPLYPTPQVFVGTERREQLIAEVPALLRPVCTYMTDAECAVFGQEVARRTEKYESRATPTSIERESPNYPRPASTDASSSG